MWYKLNNIQVLESFISYLQVELCSIFPCFLWKPHNKGYIGVVAWKEVHLHALSRVRTSWWYWRASASLRSSLDWIWHITLTMVWTLLFFFFYFGQLLSNVCLNVIYYHCQVHFLLQNLYWSIILICSTDKCWE